MSRAFSRYAPFIQEYIYAKGWKDLRQVQEEACAAILDTTGNVIIASGTASGKTEAAFFPILTDLYSQEPTSCSILYIGPMKALINDQFVRLNDLLESMEIPVIPWHGDISASVKKKALKLNRGVVQITPESLEALLMNHPEHAKILFSDLRYVVIDEIHAFMGTDRGEQLRCLLFRLQKLTGVNPRRIGLSATLADYKPAMEWLSAGTNRDCTAVGLAKGTRRISLGMSSFVLPAKEEEREAALRRQTRMLYDLSHTSKCIIFVNSRQEAEDTAARLKEEAARRHEPDIFYVHHGSIAAGIRRSVEHKMKEEGTPMVICATTTLELGIDIGDLDVTIQYGTPLSCSSFVQRLGRSGRRNEQPKMYFVNSYTERSGDAFSLLPWDLLRSLAVILLYVEDKFIEPFAFKPKPFSLLAHQTISLLFEYGELAPRDLARMIFAMPSFAKVEKGEYLDLLRNMVAEDWLEQTETKTLLPSEKADRMASHYSFYAVFEGGDEWSVYWKDLIGTLSECPDTDSFVLAGKAWRITAIHEESRKIYVEPTRKVSAQPWGGSGIDIHPAVFEKIREILTSSKSYSFLHDDAASLLEEARKLALRRNLVEDQIYPLSEHSFLIVPWKGSRLNRTLAGLFNHGLKEHLGIQRASASLYGVYFTSLLSKEELLERFAGLNDLEPSPSLILSADAKPCQDAYDHMVDPCLLQTAYALNHMDIAGALNYLAGLNWISTHSPAFGGSWNGPGNPSPDRSDGFDGDYSNEFGDEASMFESGNFAFHESFDEDWLDEPADLTELEDSKTPQ